MKKNSMSLRDVYRLFDQPGKNHLKEMHLELDKAVMGAYNFNDRKDLLSQLLFLNNEISNKESKSELVQSPGLPEYIDDKDSFISNWNFPSSKYFPGTAL